MTYVQRLLPSSLHHTGLLLILGALTLGLTGCYTQLQVADKEDQAHQGTHKKQVDQKKSYADAPLASLRTAELDTDQQRIQLATQLLEARADTKISHSTYKEGVHFFRKYSPQFYGNFFGDPFYATYDIRFSRLVRARQLAEIDVNPENSFWSPTSFFCHPFSYDPAFGGKCTGVRFAASDFFFVPMFLQPRFAVASSFPPLSPYRHDVTQAHRSPPVAEPVEETPPSADPADSLHKVPRVKASARTIASDDQSNRSSNEEESSDRSEIRSPVEGIEVPAHLPRQARIPDNIHTSMQETAASLRRTEVRLRLQRLIRQEYGGHENLSPRERAELTNRLSRTVYSSERSAGALSQGNRKSSEHKRPLGRTEYEQLIDKINREASRRSTPDRSTRSQSTSSASRPDTGGDRTDSRNSGRDTSRPTADPSERERSERSGSSSERSRSRSGNGGNSDGS